MSVSTWWAELAAGGLLGLATWLVGGVGWRRPVARAHPPAVTARLLRGTRRPRLGREAPGGPLDVALVVTEVAARLRAGSPVAVAWASATARIAPARAGAPPHGVVGTDGARRSPAEPPWLAAVFAQTRDPRVRAQLAAAAAACRLADRLGAPLADVLERCAGGIAEVARAEESLRVALAGPASTARLLGWLPVTGVLLGWALGADPVEALLDGGAGTAAGLAGLGLLLLGRRWSAALVAVARRGDPGEAEPVTREAGR